MTAVDGARTSATRSAAPPRKCLTMRQASPRDRPSAALGGNSSSRRAMSRSTALKRSAGVITGTGRPRWSASISRKIQGCARVPRPTITPSTPLLARRSRAPAAVVMLVLGEPMIRLLHPRHQLPVRLAGVKLGTRPAVHGDRLHALPFGHARHLDGVPRAVVPTGSDLHREGDGQHAPERLENLRQHRGLPHQLGAATFLGHLGGGAAAVDVDDVGPEILGHLGGVRHALRIGAEELNGQGPLGRPVAQHVAGAQILACQRLDADQLGDDQAYRPGVQLLHERPVRRVGDARHRREYEIGRNRHRTDPESAGRHRLSRHQVELGYSDRSATGT